MMTLKSPLNDAPLSPMSDQLETSVLMRDILNSEDESITSSSLNSESSEQIDDFYINQIKNALASFVKMDRNSDSSASTSSSPSSPTLSPNLGI
jgi:hypothetical protein